MPADVWKQREVAAAFLGECALLIPDRPRQLDVMLRVLRFAPRPPRRVLDLGCGDALLLAAVLEAVPEAAGLALDFSPQMLEQARARLAAFGPRAATAEADLQTPAWLAAAPWPPGQPSSLSRREIRRQKMQDSGLTPPRLHSRYSSPAGAASTGFKLGETAMAAPVRCSAWFGVPWLPAAGTRQPRL